MVGGPWGYAPSPVDFFLNQLDGGRGLVDALTATLRMMYAYWIDWLRDTPIT